MKPLGPGKPWPVALLPMRVMMVLVAGLYLIVMGGPAGSAAVSALLLIGAGLYLLATALLWHWRATAADSAPWRQAAQLLLDNMLCLAAIPFDPAPAMPLVLLAAASPLEFGLRFGLYTYQLSLVTTGATTIGVLLLRPWASGEPLSPQAFGVLLLTWGGVGYGLLIMVSINGLRNQLQDIVYRHRTAMSGVGFATWFWNSDGRAAESGSPEMDQLLGLPSGSYDGRADCLRQCMLEEDQAEFYAAVDSALRHGRGFERRFRHHRSDGTTGWLAIRGEPDSGHVSADSTRFVGVLWDVTDEINAQRSNQVAMARIDAAARTVGLGFWEFDGDSECFMLDEHARSLAGIPHSRPLSLAETMRSLPPVQAEAVESRLRASMLKGDSFDVEINWRRPDSGEAAFLRVRGHAQRRADGSISGIQGLFSDETEALRRRKEIEALRARHDRSLRAVRANAWTYNISSGLLEADQHAVAVFGLNPDASPAQSLADWLAHVDPEDAADVKAKLLRCAQTGSRFDARFRLKDNTGGTRWLRSQGEITDIAADSSNQLVGGITIDVTEEMEARENARTVSEKLDEITDSGRFGFWSLNWESKRFEVDDGWRRITGMEGDDRPLDMDQVISLLFPAQRELLLDALARTLHTGEPFSLELSALRGDNRRPIHVLARGHAVQNDDGRVSSLAGLVVDRSELATAREDTQSALDRMNTAARAGQIGFWRLEVRDNAVAFDDNAYRLIGEPLRQDISRLEQAMALVLDEDQADLQRNIEASLASGAMLLGNFRIRHRATQDVRHLHLRGEAVYADDGQLEAFSGSIQDETEVIRRQTQARQTTQMLQAALSASGMVGYVYHANEDRLIIEGDLDLLGDFALPADGIGLSDVLAMIDPADRVDLEADFHRCIEQGQSFERLHRVHRQGDSRVYWYLAIGRPTGGGATSTRDVIGVVIDETEKRARQEEMEAVRARYDAALRAGNIGAWTWFCDSGHIENDQLLETLLGNCEKPYDHQIESFFALIDERDRDRLEAIVEQARADAQPFECQYRIRSATGDERWFMSRGEPVEHDAEGQVLRMAGATWEITQLRQAQAAKDLYRNRHDYALQHTEIACWNWSADNNELVYDAWAPALMGATSEQVGHSMDGFYAQVHEADRQQIIDQFDQILSGDATEYSLEFRARNGLEALRWFRTQGQITRRADGSPDKVFGIIQDVDPEIRLRQELQRSNLELDEFAHVASHDLREPLKGLKSYASLLERRYADKLEDDGRSQLQALQQLALRLDTVVADLLKFSRFGRTGLAVADIDLQILLDEVLATLEFSLNEAGVALRVPAPLPVVRCDRVRVGELLRNLITNAIKYNDSQQKWIEVGHRDGIFHVCDNGIGIPEALQSEVFSIFRRLHDREAFGGGTGAGLSICQRIVEQHGGHLWLRSAPGRGSCFYFTLDADTPTTGYDIPAAPVADHPLDQ